MDREINPLIGMTNFPHRCLAPDDQNNLSEQNFFFDPKPLTARKTRKQRQDERRGQGGDNSGGLLDLPKRQARGEGEKRTPAPWQVK